jgi:hypothetical protein
MSEDDEPIEPKAETYLTPDARAAEKVAELRMHSELAAIFEGPRKFEANLTAGLDPDIARDVQRSMAKFERSKVEATPVLDAASMPDAFRILELPTTAALTTNDYHIYRRPGEVMIARWLAGDEIDTFIGRYQAHCDAALAGAREEDRSSLEWRGDEQTTAYLTALDAAELNAELLYYREPIRKHGICVITTTATDEMNIRFLCSHLMGAEISDVVGTASAPGDDATDRELAWYFKLFSLRGAKDGVERMCFFTFLQKSDDDFDF